MLGVIFKKLKRVSKKKRRVKKKKISGIKKILGFFQDKFLFFRFLILIVFD